MIVSANNQFYSIYNLFIECSSRTRIKEFPARVKYLSQNIVDHIESSQCGTKDSCCGRE